MTLKNESSDGSFVADEDHSSISILDFLLTLADNLRLLVLGPIFVAVFVFAGTFLIAPIFTAKAVFLPPQQQQSMASSMLASLGALGGLAGAATGLKNPNDQYISFMRTNAVVDALINRFELQKRYELESREKTRKAVEINSRIVSGKDNLIAVEFDDEDPAFAAEVANAYVDELSKFINRLAVTEAQQRRVFFAKQLEAAKNDLTKAQQLLAGSGVSVAALNANPSTALEGPSRLRAQVTAQEVKLASMRSYLTDSAPEFRQAQAELSALRGQLAKAEQAQPENQTGNTNDYIAKYREFKYQETLFDLFSRQFELAKVDEAREGAVIQVVDTAMSPEKKSRPKRAIAALIALVVSGFILFVFVLIRSSIRKGQADPVVYEKMSLLKKMGRRALRGGSSVRT